MLCLWGKRRRTEEKFLCWQESKHSSRGKERQECKNTVEKESYERVGTTDMKFGIRKVALFSQDSNNTKSRKRHFSES